MNLTRPTNVCHVPTEKELLITPSGSSMTSTATSAANSSARPTAGIPGGRGA